ncbi:hypothetical protein [Phenylobacterium sp. J367]|uniref:hypothetical protein n=1 Tax=Phenylobacterium sp. J367 TaxID=2898435 RepID=UPI002151F1DA|nr:hypothetical protein [Phenylobacterium sp. J367]MCR5881158.1 hypothetical protein [Phenylobacterium sp. J367]
MALTFSAITSRVGPVVTSTAAAAPRAKASASGRFASGSPRKPQRLKGSTISAMAPAKLPGALASRSGAVSPPAPVVLTIAWGNTGAAAPPTASVAVRTSAYGTSKDGFEQT